MEPHMTDNDDEFEIHIERGAPDRLLPEHFWDILAHRYFPVLSLTYVSTVVGIAMRSGDFVGSLFFEKAAYQASFFVALWVSIPALIWVLLRGSALFRHYADGWYKISAGLMTLTLLISYVLLPEINVLGLHLRTYFAATIPVFFIMYFFFVKEGLPPKAAHPLSAVGLTFLFYGALVNFLF